MHILLLTCESVKRDAAWLPRTEGSLSASDQKSVDECQLKGLSIMTDTNSIKLVCSGRLRPMLVTMGAARVVWVQAPDRQLHSIPVLFELAAERLQKQRLHKDVAELVTEVIDEDEEDDEAHCTDEDDEDDEEPRTATSYATSVLRDPLAAIYPPLAGSAAFARQVLVGCAASLIQASVLRRAGRL